MSHFRILCVVFLAVIFAACSSPIVPTASSSVNERALSNLYSNSTVQVRFQIDNSWDNGFSASVVLTNVGSSTINPWDIEWATSTGISNVSPWSIDFSTTGSSYKGASVSYNSTISAGSSVSFGYTANGSSSNAFPSWVKFKGTLLNGGSTLAAPSIAPAQKPVEKYGQLKVVGNQIRSQSGSVVQLRGVSSHGLQWFPFVAHQTVKNLVATFKPDVIRAAMYVKEWDQAQNQYAGYLGAQPSVKQTLINVVEDAIDEGVYVIVDWHIHWNPPTSSNPYWTGDPYTSQAVQFFGEMASLSYLGKPLKDYPNVIWEVMNEPGSSISWSSVKAHANAVIQQIRGASGDSDNLILVPSTNWAKALDQVVNDSSGDRPDRQYSNIVYTFHFYAGTNSSDHREGLRSVALGALNAGLALFADEWGTGDYTGNGSPNQQESQIWVDWMNSNSVSWSTWSVCDKSEATALLNPGVGLAGPWTDSQLSQSGTWVKSWISAGR